MKYVKIGFALGIGWYLGTEFISGVDHGLYVGLKPYLEALQHKIDQMRNA